MATGGGFPGRRICLGFPGNLVCLWPPTAKRRRSRHRLHKRAPSTLKMTNESPLGRELADSWNTILEITERKGDASRICRSTWLPWLDQSRAARIFLPALRSSARDEFEGLLLPRRNKFGRPCSLRQTFACLSMTSKRRALAHLLTSVGSQRNALKETAAKVKRGGLKALLESSANTSSFRRTIIAGLEAEEGASVEISFE